MSTLFKILFPYRSLQNIESSSQCYTVGFYCVCSQSLSRIQLFVTPWTAARQAPLFIEFSRQEYRSGLPFPTPGIEPASPENPALQVDSLLLSYREACFHHRFIQISGSILRALKNVIFQVACGLCCLQSCFLRGRAGASLGSMPRSELGSSQWKWPHRNS